MKRIDMTKGQRDAIAFTGNTLGPFFSEDPEKGNAAALYQAFEQLDAGQAAAEWPFGDTSAVREALTLMVRGVNEDRGDLTHEYRRLFVGPAHKAAPPWGSVYTDRDGVIFGDSALDLHDWLSDSNVLVTAHDNMPDDEIGRMLSLMAWMADNRPDLLEQYLSEHLLTWAFHFLDKLGDETMHPFFVGLAKLTYESLAGIRDELGLHVEQPRFYR